MVASFIIGSEWNYTYAADDRNVYGLTGNVIITKTDEDTGEPIVGAEYILKGTSADGEINIEETAITDNKGKMVFADIPVGEYTLEETKPASGYIADSQSHPIVLQAEKTTKKYSNIYNITIRISDVTNRMHSWILENTNEMKPHYNGPEYTTYNQIISSGKAESVGSDWKVVLYPASLYNDYPSIGCIGHPRWNEVYFYPPNVHEGKPGGLACGYEVEMELERVSEETEEPLLFMLELFSENSSDGRRSKEIEYIYFEDDEARKSYSVDDPAEGPMASFPYGDFKDATPDEPAAILSIDNGNASFVVDGERTEEIALYENIEFKFGIPIIEQRLENVIVEFEPFDYEVNDQEISLTAKKINRNIPIEIEWNDEDDLDGKRPDSVSVNLLKGGEVIDTIELTEENNWKHAFTGLVRFDGDKEIMYSVEQDPVDAYLLKKAGDIESGFKFTDIHRAWVPSSATGSDEWGAFKITKTVKGETEVSAFPVQINFIYDSATASLSEYTHRTEIKKEETLKFDYVPAGTRISVDEIAEGFDVTYMVDGKEGNELAIEKDSLVEVAILNEVIAKTEPPQDSEPEPRPTPVNSYEIVYDLNGGEYNGSTNNIIENHEAGTVISIHDAPVREGYTFLYWKGSMYQPGDRYKVVGKHTFVAQWGKTENITQAEKQDKSASPKTGDVSKDYLSIFVIATLLLTLFLERTRITKRKIDEGE